MVMSQNGARSSGGAAAQAADLGPLAWVLEETRRSIETASKKTISFARDAKASLGVDMSSVDASQLRLARQQLHQAVGALEMVGQPVASQMVRGMEAVVQQFAQHPDKCTDESASVLEQAGFALLEYLEGVLGDKPRPALGLFPQYARIQTMAGADRVHPADLWDFQWHWANPDTPAAAQRNTYSAEVRSRLDHCVLNIMRRADLNAAIEMGVVCLGLADGEESGQKPAVFWKLASAFMQALGVQAAPLDIYAKRATSRILLQYATLAGGDKKISERLAQDLLFFCAQADMQGKDAPVLAAVRKAWGLSSYTPIPYDKPIFGLYDPAVLEQASRRIEAIKENWSALAGGDMGRLKACVDQFGLVVESLTRLHQNSKPLADALSRVSEHVAKTAQPPSHELAMETATAVLFLEASFADFQPSDAEFTRRLNQLAERLDAVRSGQQAPELESWMEELYRRVSDRETLGTVVGELRTTLGEAEQLLDQFLRAPDDRQPLETANTLLGQMRGVLMVLGLEPAAHAVSRMRESITSWQKTEGNPAQGNDEELEHFGNSLGALASLVDMMGYQPALAGELFFYDEESGELKYDASRAQPPQPLQEAGDVLSAEEPQQAASSAAEEVEDLLIERAPETLPGQLEELAGRAALEEKPALAQAARSAAEAARSDDGAALSQALDVLQSVAGTSPAEPQPHEQQEEPEEEPIDEGLDAELLEIFLEEAREVVQTGSAALQTLASAPGDMEQQTTLRRAFHTLKGSSRMVGLTEFGEAAWALEQVMNAWLAEKKPVSDNLRTLTGDALQAFGRWVEDISIRRSGRWKSAPFRTSADAFRLEGKLMPLELATEKKTAAPEPASTSVVAPEPAPAAPAPAVAAAPEPVAPVVAAASEPTAPDPVAAPEPIAAAEVPDELPLDISADIEIEAVQAPCAPVDEPEVIQFEASAGFEEPAAQAVDVAEMADASIGLVAEEMPEGEEQLVSLESIELPSLDLPLAEEDASEPSAEVPPVAPEAAEPQPEQAEDDDTKHIGDLVISTSLYNVYLEEAEKQSHQLMDELERWAADVSRPVPEGAGISAHSLAGNSATVGFTGLSELARAVEHALQRLQEQAHGTERQAKVLCDAANEIRSVLHQFAAGTFKNPSIVVQARVRALEPVPTSPAPLTANIPPAPVAEAPASAPTVPPAAIELPAPAQAVPEVEVQPAAPIEIAPVVEDAPVAEPPAPEPAAPAAPIELAPSPAAFEVPPAPIEIPAAPAAVPSAPTAAPPAAPVAAPATVAAAGGTFAGIQEVDDFNPDMFEIFSEEAEDLFPRLDEALRGWQSSPDSLEANKEVRRVLHTLKGSARMAGLLRLGEMAHRIESAIETVGTEGVQAEAVEAVQADVDELQDAFRMLQEGGGAPLPQAVEVVDMPAAAPIDVPAAPEPPAVAVAPAPIEAAPEPAVLQAAPPAPIEVPVEPITVPEVLAAPVATPASSAPVAPAPVTAPAHAPVAGSGTFADIQEVDNTDPDMFEIFSEEAEDLLPRLDEALRTWAASPNSLEANKEVRRVLHTFKGGARVAGALRLGEMAHRIESAIETVGTEGVQAEAVEAVQADVDELQDAFRRVQETGSSAPLQSEPPAPVAAPAQPAALSSQPPVVVSASQPAVVAQPAALAPVVAQPAALAPVAAQPAPAPVQPATAASVPQPAPAALAQPLPKPTLPAAPIEVPAAAVATAPVPSAPRDGLEDIADLRDAVDPDLFPIVVEEAQEMFPRLTEFLRVWGASPEASEPREGMMRALHALKGSARMAGARRLGEMAHRTEASIAAISTEDEVSAADVAAIAANVDKLQDLLREMQGKPPVQKKPTPAPKPAQAPAAAPAPASQQAAATPAAAVRPQPTGQVAPPAPLSMVQARAAASQAVRVRSQLLDRLVTQSGEVMTSRARLEVGVNHLRTALGDLTGNLERLRQQLRDVEMQAESQLQSRQALARDDQRNFDPLEFDRFTRLQELTRMMAESVNDVATVQRGLQRAVESCENDLAAQARQSRELQRDLLRTRMVEFESISERLYRVVRQAAREVGKKVRMDITGGTIEMDRGILERMTGAFEHLLRNSVTHGIEDEDVRVARNKDATGLVSVDVQQAGNDVSITFRDDGAGLNLERIREKAIQKGIITPEQKLSNDEIARLVFASGLSTAAKVSGLAGRGVGMDVVRSEVQALGGRIEIGTEPGKGSSFRLVLPLTMAVTHVVMLRCGKLQVGVPSNVVEIVRRVTQEQLQEAYRSGHYSYGGEELDFYWSGALLQSSTRSTEPPARTMPVVIFRSAAQRVAVHVDEVLSNQEVVVKALGPQLSRLPGLVAITSLASGEVALIYNPVALAAVYGEQARRQVQAAQQPEVAAQAGAPAALAPEETPAAAPLVLVVDDSITVRRVTQRMLQREGFRVAMAADGLQGLERLQEERPAVVLSDIEMPRMDGFDFVRNIRADERMAGLPVIMITSRIADKHREHAQELGVNHYLGKPYSEETLLGLIRQYAGVAVPAQ